MEDRTKKIAIVLGLVVSVAIIAVEIYICGAIGDIIGEIVSDCEVWWDASPKIG